MLAALALGGVWLATQSNAHDEKKHAGTSLDPALYPMSNIPPPSRRERPLDRLHVGQAHGIQNADQRAIVQTGLHAREAYRGLRPNQARRAGIESTELPLRGYNATDVNYHWKWSRSARFMTDGTPLDLAPLRQPLVLSEPDAARGLNHQPHTIWHPDFNPSTGRRRIGTQAMRVA